MVENRTDARVATRVTGWRDRYLALAILVEFNTDVCASQLTALNPLIIPEQAQAV